MVNLKRLAIVAIVSLVIGYFLGGSREARKHIIDNDVVLTTADKLGMEVWRVKIEMQEARESLTAKDNELRKYKKDLALLHAQRIKRGGVEYITTEQCFNEKIPLKIRPNIDR